MPQVNRKRVIREQVTAQSQEGEITINLNLKITIDGDSTIKIEAGTAEAIPTSTAITAEEKVSEYKPPEIVPTELFSNNDDLMSGFGQDD